MSPSSFVRFAIRRVPIAALAAYGVAGCGDESVAMCEGGAECAASATTTCTVGSETFQVDELVSSDCNDSAWEDAPCVCGTDGNIECPDGCNVTEEVDCTELDCDCHPNSEWWRDYISGSTGDCGFEDFECSGSTVPFHNACGCGCAQSIECPQTFDCQAPNVCDFDMIESDCPYSTVLR